MISEGTLTPFNAFPVPTTVGSSSAEPSLRKEPSPQSLQPIYLSCYQA